MPLAEHEPRQRRSERGENGQRQDLKLPASLAIEPVETLIEQDQHCIEGDEGEEETKILDQGDVVAAKIEPDDCADRLEFSKDELILERRSVAENAIGGFLGEDGKTALFGRLRHRRDNEGRDAGGDDPACISQHMTELVRPLLYGQKATHHGRQNDRRREFVAGEKPHEKGEKHHREQDAPLPLVVLVGKQYAEGNWKQPTSGKPAEVWRQSREHGLDRDRQQESDKSRPAEFCAQNGGNPN